MHSILLLLKNRLILMICFSLVAVHSSLGQINNYTFSQASEPYSPISLDSLMGNTTTDDQNFNNIRLGFPFKYNGQTYGSISVNHNGFVVMGPVSGYGFTDACISVANASGRALNSTNSGSTNNLVSAFNMDLQATGYSSFGIKRNGTAPNRSFIVQWKDVRRYASSAGSDTVNVQIRLYETTNVVEFRYGICRLLADQAVPLLVQVGLRGNSASEFANRESASDWAATSAGSSNLNGVVFSTSLNPVSGLIYRYSPLPPAENDLGTVAVLSPGSPTEGCVLSNNEKIKIVIRNNGTLGQTSLPVGYRIGNGPVVNQTFTRATPLASGSQDTLTFTQGADFSTIGTYKVIAFTKLSTELPISRGNDTLSNFQVKITPARNLPQPIVTTFPIGQQSGWLSGKGKNNPTGNTSGWTTAFPFASESIALPVSTTSANIQDWFYSPNFNVSNYSVLIFRAAITADLFGSTAVNSIGDDTIKVLASFDCGASWKTLKSFKQSDLTVDSISNNLREFRFKLTDLTAAKVLIAFKGSNNNTAGTNTYRFHLDDIEIREIPPFDAGVTAILKPAAASPGCVLSSSEPLTVIIRNSGSSSFNSLQIGYTVNNGSPVNETFTLVPALQPGKTDTLTFSSANGANLSQPGLYSFKAFTNLTGEIPSTVTNDTIKNFKINLSAPFSIPSQLISTYSIALANSWKKGKGFPTITDTVSNWFSSISLRGTETVSLLSGTSASPQREWMISPTYAVTADAILVASLAVSRGNSNALPNANMGDDTLKIMVSQNCGATWKVLKKFSQQDVVAKTINDTLKRFAIPLNLGVGSVSIAFLFQNNSTGASSNYRVHFKDVQIRQPLLNNDLAAIAILSPLNNIAFCPLSQQEKIRVVINNQGLLPQTSASVGYRIGNGPATTEVFTFTPGPLLPGALDTVQFEGANGANFSTNGIFQVKAFAKLSNEDVGGIVNDTVRNFRVEVRAAQSSQAFVEFFDANLNNPTGWVPGKKLFAFQEFKVKSFRGFGLTNGYSAALNISNPIATLNSPRYKILANSPSGLKFKFRLVDNSGDLTQLRSSDSIVVRYTEDCGATYKSFIKIDSLNYTPNNLFVDTSKSLSGLEGKEVMFVVYAKVTKTDTSTANFDLDNWIIEAITSNQDQLSNNASISIYPNPASDQIMVSSFEDKLKSIRIINLAGQMIQSHEKLGSESEAINTSKLSPGLYLVEVVTNKTRLVKKLEILK